MNGRPLTRATSTRRMVPCACASRGLVDRKGNVQRAGEQVHPCQAARRKHSVATGAGGGRCRNGPVAAAGDDNLDSSGPGDAADRCDRIGARGQRRFDFVAGRAEDVQKPHLFGHHNIRCKATASTHGLLGTSNLLSVNIDGCNHGRRRPQLLLCWRCSSANKLQNDLRSYDFTPWLGALQQRDNFIPSSCNVHGRQD